MSLDTIDDYCEEILHLSYILQELHHYTNYNVESVRLEYSYLLINLRDELNKITNEEWFKTQLKGDELIAGE